jgi:hypothetical protein
VIVFCGARGQEASNPARNEQAFRLIPDVNTHLNEVLRLVEIVTAAGMFWGMS